MMWIVLLLIERARCLTKQKQSNVVNIDGDQGLFNWADCVGSTQFVPSFTIINSRG